jgi:hypothetical protein
MSSIRKYLNCEGVFVSNWWRSLRTHESSAYHEVDLLFLEIFTFFWSLISEKRRC